MAKYTITHVCGHTATLQLFGKSRDRQWHIDKAEQDICSDCWKAKQIEADKQAAEQNAAIGLPALTGTEKQILWAEKIRADKLAMLDKIPGMAAYEVDAYWTWHHLRDAISKDDEKAISAQCESRADLFRVAIQLPIMQKSLALLREQTKASWWIDNRDTKLSAILAELLRNMPAEQPAENKPLEIDAAAEATVRPESPVTETIAEIRTLDKRVRVLFPEKIESFRLLMRKHGFTWSTDRGYWFRELSNSNGAAHDRAAEIGHILLGNGFIIRIYDETVRAMAVNGNFAPEQTRWIKLFTSGAEQGRLCVHWGRDEDFYKAAKRLPTARYAKPDVSVAVEQFEQVLDFAGINGFSISDAAMEAIDKARSARDSALVAKVELSERENLGDDGKPIKLETPDHVDIDDELRD
jgi:hypothetical protein